MTDPNAAREPDGDFDDSDLDQIDYSNPQWVAMMEARVIAARSTALEASPPTADSAQPPSETSPNPRATAG